MPRTKSLVKDSAIYGGSTILVKMISWLLTTLFTYTLAQSDFGMMTNLYAYVALIIIVLTFGMETGFFRFVNQNETYLPTTVYSTVLMLVGGINFLFLLFFQLFLPALHPYLWNNSVPESYIRLILVVLSLDAFSSIPFAYLRYKKKVWKFGFLKLLNVILYTLLCVFFLIACPWINRHHPTWIAWFWHNNTRLGYVFVSNLIATGIETVCLIPELTGFRYCFNKTLAKEMLHYCFPLMLMGLTGMSNQVVDKIIFPAVYSDPTHWSSELGVYSACFKISMIMIIFTQAFRYAYEPFVFEKSKEKDSSQSYANVMKYFIILGLSVFLSVVFYLDIIKYFISPTYFGALKIVPVVLMGELFFSVYFNLSIWYKLSDKTYWGTILSIIAFIVIIVLNLLLIPQYSYQACAWAAFIGNAVIMILSYFIGQKNYLIRYDLKAIGLYTSLAMSLYVLSDIIPIDSTIWRLIINTVLLGIYVIAVLKFEASLRVMLLHRFR